jgi:hypothetical protein
LETSTDAAIVEAAAAMVPDMQLPVDLNLEPAMIRLSDTFHGCLNSTYLRNGMGNRAKACLKAFGMLQVVTEVQEGLWSFKYQLSYMAGEPDAEFETMVRCINAEPLKSTRCTPAIRSWILRLIPALHLYRNPNSEDLFTIVHFFSAKRSPVLADFLFCIISFMKTPNIYDVSLMDKRWAAVVSYRATHN